MYKYFFIILFLRCLVIPAQVSYTDYQNAFPQTYVGFGNSIENDAAFDAGNLYMAGIISISPQNQSVIFKKTMTNATAFKIYHANPQTTLKRVIFNSKLKNHYAFISTDATAGCASAGLKVLKLNKNDLSIVDSVFFCDPTKASDGIGYFFYNRFYTTSFFAQYFSTMPNTYYKIRSLIRRIDTNLVMLNEQILGDTSVTFGAYFLREAIDTGIIVNTINVTDNCPMLIKLDTMGVELWRKKYYSYAQTGCPTSSGNGIMGLQNYQNGYIALFDLAYGCNSFYYSSSIIAKIDKNGNLIKEVQYSSNGDSTLEFNSNLNNYIHRAIFKNILIKTNEGNFASVITEKQRYGLYTPKNYIVILDTNLNIIHRSPELGEINNSFYYPGMVQGSDSTFYLGGAAMNITNDGTNVRIYTWKPGGQVGVMEYKNEQPFKIYPNPTVNELTIDAFESNQLITIYNNMGQMVYSEIHNGIIKVNVSTWAKGLYLIELSDTEKHSKHTQKFIVEKQ